MPTILVKNIDYLATFDDARREFKDGALLVRDNIIERVATTSEIGSMPADRVLDLFRPYCHARLGQHAPPYVPDVDPRHGSGRRIVRLADHALSDLGKLDDEAIYVSARVAMAELIQSGCTTSSDPPLRPA